jgi:hypothetical protein
MAVKSTETMKRVKAFIYLWTKRLYWIIATIGIIGICMMLFKQNKQVAAVLVFLGGLMAAYFYYVKWFVIPDSRPGWPPYVTPCPDFLTLMDPGDPSKGKAARCVDFVGVSANGMLAKTDVTSAGEVSRSGSSNKVFEVKTTAVDPETNTVKPASKRELCDSVELYGLTWLSMCGE